MGQAKKKEMHQTKVKLGNKGIECDCDTFTTHQLRWSNLIPLGN